MKKYNISILMTYLILSSALYANSTVINFEPITNASNMSYPLYIESGFQLTWGANNIVYPGINNQAFISWGSSSPNYAGSQAFTNNGSYASTMLSKVGGGSFNLNSIDLCLAYINSYSSSVTFTGYFLNGSSIKTTVVLDSSAHAFQTFYFDGMFNDVISVDWRGPKYFPTCQFDNIKIDQNIPPVPEPSTFILLGAGLGGIALYRRRMKK